MASGSHESGTASHVQATLASTETPTPDDVVRLEEAALRLRPAICWVGRPDGTHATAFVISRKYRLLATAAHVADLAFDKGGLLAVPEGTTVAYRVERVWYHPGIVRKLDEGLYAVIG